MILKEKNLIASEPTKFVGRGLMYEVKNSLELNDSSVPAVKKMRFDKYQLGV